MQPPRRFQAPTVEEAYERVREELGDDAIILSTRVAKAQSGLWGAPAREFIEIIATLPDGVVPQPRPRPAPQPAAEPEPRGRIGGLVDPPRISLDALEAAVGTPPRVPLRTRLGLKLPERRLPEPPPPPEEDGDAGDELAPPFANDLAGAALRDPDLGHRLREAAPPGLLDAVEAMAGDAPLDDLPPAAAVDVAEPERSAPAASLATLGEQIAEMRRMLEDLTSAQVQGRLDRQPERIRAARRRLLEHGLGPNVLAPVLEEVADAVVPTADLDAVLRTIERKLTGKLPPAVKLNLAKRPHAIFLVGPSGAGKTTMAIRLAMEIERAYSVRATIAGTDVNRIGGPQQLSAFGVASGVAVRLCYTPGELQALLAEQPAGGGVVIVDTPGHSGAQRDRMTELAAFVRVAKHRSVLLTLPATTKLADLQATAAGYRPLGLAGLVLTRCDETSSFGALFTAAVEAGLGVAYTAHGEPASDAPRAGDHFAFARAVVSGAWPAPSAPLAAARRREPARAG